MTGVRERLVHRATRRYVAGPELADAVDVALTVGHATTLGYWDSPGDSPGDVASLHGRAVAAIAAQRLDSYVSIKLPALGHRRPRGPARRGCRGSRCAPPLRLAGRGARGPHAGVACRLGARGYDVGATLPGCWSRSVHDAEALAAAGVRARIVKGQWPGDADPGTGFLAVAEVVARTDGRAAIATHDGPLARATLALLPHAELELLFGLPTAAAARTAEPGTPVRIYVPFGRGYLPYAVRRAVAHPALLWWLVRDLASPRLVHTQVRA